MTFPRVAVEWHAAPNLLWTQFDDGGDWVVYDPASADVHQLTDAAHYLWQLIADRRANSLESLAAALAARMDRTPDEALAAHTRAALESMDGIGLIRPTLS